jgi:hypothetical protein
MEAFSDRQHAHELIERLSASLVPSVVRFLEFVLMDPVARAVATAPPDDEPVTDEDRSRFHEGQDWFQRHGGKCVPMEEVLSEFGLKPDDFPSEHPS